MKLLIVQRDKLDEVIETLEPLKTIYFGTKAFILTDAVEAYLLLKYAFKKFDDPPFYEGYYLGAYGLEPIYSSITPFTKEIKEHESTHS